VSFNLSTRLVALLLAPLMLGTGVTTLAYGAGAAKKTAAEADEAVIRRLEQSGALDQAVDRSVQRLVHKQTEERQKAQDEALAKRNELAKNARAVDAARDHLLGDPQAAVSIIEYSDFECPYCKRFHGIPEAVVKRLDGKANLVWRHFPLEFHNPAALREAEATECAARQGGNDAFWIFADELMKRTRSNGKGLPGANGDPLLAVAQELKLDVAAFGGCLASAETRTQIGEDRKDGEAAGVTGTPGIVLRHNASGKVRMIEGAISDAALEAQIRELLPVD